MKRRDILKSSMAVAATGFIPSSVSAGVGRAASGYIRTNWSIDPYSLGSYSFIAKGAKKSDHARLGKSIGGRLFFAGEATHPDYNSTVHAAYESGLIAAEGVTKTAAKSIGIVGAGISGLATAMALDDGERRVTVFEARDRIGGRIWTDDQLGMPLDLGASWIHGTDGNPLTDLALELDAQTIPTEESYIIRGDDGRMIAYSDAPEWLDDVVSIEHSAGASPEQINTWAYWRNSDYDGDEVIFPLGYSQLLERFSGRFDVKLGRQIDRIDTASDRVVVTDNQNQKAVFDTVVVTVPLGVLKKGSIAFNPPLPLKKQGAIERLGMGVLDKVYLKYDDVFWDEDVTWIATPENGLPPGQFNQWLNLYPYIGQPIIMAFNGAKAARDLSALPDTAIIDRAQKTLNTAYP